MSRPFVFCERNTGIEPASQAWEARALPMCYFRRFCIPYILREPIPGLEPGTYALRMRCSTN